MTGPSSPNVPGAPDGPGVPRRRARSPRIVAAAAVAIVGSLAIAGAMVARNGTPTADAPRATASPPGATPVRLCGVADAGAYSALPAGSTAEVVETVVPDVEIGGDARPGSLVVTDGRIVTLARSDRGTLVTHYSSDGGVEESFTIPTPQNGSAPSTFAVDADGLVVTSSSADATTEVVAYAPDGSPEWTVDVADLDRGSVTAVFGWSGGGDAVAAVAFSDSEQVALVGADGDLEPDGPEIVAGVPFPQSDGTLLVRTEEDDDVMLRRYSATGELLGSFGGPAQDTSSNGGPAQLERPTGVAVGPDGGYIVAGPRYRVVEVSEDGVWRRVALSGEGMGGAVFTMAEQSPLVRDGDDFYFYSDDGSGGTSLSRVDVAGMGALLDAPVTYDIAHASTTARLGYGAGLLTDARYDYFAADEEPEVLASFDPWWGALAGTYELRYTVTGDPTTGSAPEGSTGTVEIPADGGRVALDLPEAAPGPYDVHAEIVEKESGEVRSATCLRYAVGAVGAELEPEQLADGADWGGAGPVRGVQLAHQLGIGSYRVQIEFGRLVPEVTAEPSPADLDLSALPGAEDGDPFAGLAAASRDAEALGVELYVQVGQGGEAEHQAVSDGTWGAWTAAIVTALRDEVPGLHLWSPWNEPNNTGFGDGGDYVRQVLAPFASAVRGADPEALVIGGDALNVIVPWYAQLVDAGGCESLDIVGIHPYTGFNRSWDEEGTDGPIGQITELKDLLATCGEDPPAIWATESGWWSDGPANQWGQAYDVVRSMLWMRHLGVDEWTYFFSEGGWGEGGFSWSLLQIESFVKPSALAMSTAGRLLADRPTPELVDTGAWFVHAMRTGPAPDGDDDLLAVWTEDLPAQVVLSAAGGADVTVTDLYGGTRTLEIGADEQVTLDVSGAPVFLSTPTGTDLVVAQPEAVGDDLLASGTATASSSADDADPAAVLEPNGAGTSPWRAGVETSDGQPDVSPWLQVDLGRPATLDRVLVVSAGIRCCTSGLRDYTVSVLPTDGEWQEVGRVTDQFLARGALVRFDAVEVTAVRVDIPSTTERGVTVPALNYSGQTAGLHPAWTNLQLEAGWTASVVAVQGYGP